MLTAKREKFVQNLVKGMSQREAYKKSFNAKNMSNNAIDREASVLFKNPKVFQRYEELIGKLEKKTIMSAQERLEYLTGIVKDTEKEQVVDYVDGKRVRIEKPADLNTKIRAIDVMNKMQGEYVTKVEGNIGVTKLEDLL